jgi:integrase
MKPTQVTQHGKKVWSINVPEKVWGKRTRLFAATAQEVQQKFNLAQRRALLGIDNVEFTDEDKRARQELGDRGTLMEAVRCFLAHKPAKVEKTLGDAIRECVARKRELNRRSAYTRHLETILNQFSIFVGKDTLVSAITANHVEGFLRSGGWAITTRQPMRKRLSAFFSFCQNSARGYCATNPAAVDDKDDDRERVVRPPPRIFTPDEAKALLSTAQEQFPHLLPYVVLGLFCGIRPDELTWLKPEHIHLDRGNVEIPADVSKTHQRRFVELSANALEWLRVAPSLEVSMRRYWHKKLVKAAGVKWSSDVMRHSFASYHIERDHSADKTALQLGHQGSTVMLFKHYKQTVTSEAAKEFWAIMPKPIVKVMKGAA